MTSDIMQCNICCGTGRLPDLTICGKCGGLGKSHAEAPNIVAPRCEKLKKKLLLKMEELLKAYSHPKPERWAGHTDGVNDCRILVNEAIEERVQTDERRTHTEVTHNLPQNPSDLLSIESQTEIVRLSESKDLLIKELREALETYLLAGHKEARHNASIKAKLALGLPADFKTPRPMKWKQQRTPIYKPATLAACIPKEGKDL